MHTILLTILAFFQVVFIDLVLAGDNAVVVGLAASGLPGESRRKAILIGIGIATVLRIALALLATALLGLVGLLLAGGLLLLWVCWKLFRELYAAPKDQEAASDAPRSQGAPGLRKSLAAATRQIVIADVSMSVDNVLAVAGAAHDHPVIMVFGLALSVVLTGIAASLIANVLKRHRWVAYAGLIVIVGVAGSMIYRGAAEISTPLMRTTSGIIASIDARVPALGR
jgi:YjbE family integral membrane protein